MYTVIIFIGAATLCIGSFVLTPDYIKENYDIIDESILTAPADNNGTKVRLTPPAGGYVASNEKQLQHQNSISLNVPIARQRRDELIFAQDDEDLSSTACTNPPTPQISSNISSNSGPPQNTLQRRVSTVAVMGQNSPFLKESLTSKKLSHDQQFNRLSDSLYTVNPIKPTIGSLEYRYKQVFSHEDISEKLGVPLPRNITCQASSSSVTTAAQKMIQYVKANTNASHELQQILCTLPSDPTSQIFNKLISDFCSFSALKFVHTYRPGCRKSFSELKKIFSTVCMSQNRKVLIVVDLPSLRERCFDNEEFVIEALKLLEEELIQQADYIADPAETDMYQKISVQTVTTDDDSGSPDTYQFRLSVNSQVQISPVELKENEFVLLLHLKAYSIRNHQPVITSEHYLATASEFGLTTDQAESLLKKLQNACLLYCPSESEQLKEFIFLDMQWLCDSFNEALNMCSSSGDPFCSFWYRFHTKGLLTQELLDHIESKTAATVTGLLEVNLPRNWILLLLEHIQLLSKLPSKGQLPKAFSPLFLPEESLDEEIKFHQNADISSEYFLPIGGYAPPPLYMMKLITLLCRREEFCLDSCQSLSTAVFKLTNYNDTKVKLSLWNGFIRMQFCCTIDGESFTTQMKQNIAMFLNDAVLSASKVVSKSFATNQMPASSCTNVYLACSLKDCKYKVQHLALCDYRKGVVECVKTGRKMSRVHLPPSQQCWFNVNKELDIPTCTTLRATVSIYDNVNINNKAKVTV